jgi:hypothetical protein
MMAPQQNLIAGRLLATRPQGLSVADAKLVDLAREVLSHGAGSAKPICDRFVLTQAFIDAVDNRPDQWEIARQFAPVSTPAWLEYSYSARDRKALTGTAWLILEGRTLLFLEHVNAKRGIFLAGSYNHQDFREAVACSPGAEVTIPFTVSDRVKPEYLSNKNRLTNQCLFGAIFATLLNYPGVVDVEQVAAPTPLAGSTAAERAFIRARARKGKSFFDYKIVKPGNQISAPIPGDGTGLARSAQRAHAVIGHWRLLDSREEPIWTWVDAHEAGDRSIGIITKERHVGFTGGGTRRGFIVPAAAGTPGERRIAERPA